MTNLLQAAKKALADLEGIMPEFEPDGKTHPAWTTIEELRHVIAQRTNLLKVCKLVAEDIEMYLSGKWEGTIEGWRFTLKTLYSAIEKDGTCYVPKE